MKAGDLCINLTTYLYNDTDDNYPNSIQDDQVCIYLSQRRWQGDSNVIMIQVLVGGRIGWIVKGAMGDLKFDE